MALQARHCGTRFGRWVRTQGVSRIVRGLERRGVRVTRQAVYSYVYGRRTPRLEVRAGIASLSGGSILPVDIDRHVMQVRGAEGRKPPSRAA